MYISAGYFGLGLSPNELTLLVVSAVVCAMDCSSFQTKNCLNMDEKLFDKIKQKIVEKEVYVNVFTVSWYAKYFSCNAEATARSLRKKLSKLPKVQYSEDELVKANLVQFQLNFDHPRYENCLDKELESEYDWRFWMLTNLSWLFLNLDHLFMKRSLKSYANNMCEDVAEDTKNDTNKE